MQCLQVNMIYPFVKDVYFPWSLADPDRVTHIPLKFLQRICLCEYVKILIIPSKHLLVLKTSSARLQRNNFTSSKTSWRRLEDMSWRRLEDMSWRCLEDISWRRLEDMSWRCLEDMSWRHLEDILETNKILTGNICILFWG